MKISTRRRFNFRGLLPVIMTCLYVTGALAQTVTVNNVSVNSSAPTVTTENTINVLGGTNAEGVYSFTGGVNINDVEPSNPTFTYKINQGALQSGTIRINGTNLIISNVSVPLANTGDYELSFTVTYQYNVYSGEGENQTVTKETRVLTGTSPTVIKVWEAPEINHPTVESDVLTGSTVNFSVASNGGNPSGWRYNWNAPSKTGTGVNFSYAPVNNGSSMIGTNVTVTTENVGPDGSTIWYSNTYTYPLNVYPTPTASLTLPVSAVYSGKTIDCTAVITGGNPNGWQYSWTTSLSSAKGSNKEFTYTAPVISGSEAAKDLLSLNVNNLSPDNNASWYQMTFPRDITVYPNPEVRIECADNNIYEGESAILNAVTTGGQIGKWTYEWYVDGQKQTAIGSQFNYTATYPASNQASSRVVEIEVRATNAADGVAASAVVNSNYKLTIWRTPEITNASKPKIGAYSGDAVTLSADTKYGNPSGWNYDWTRDGTPYTDGDNLLSISVTENVEIQTEYKYQLNARNSIDGHEVTLNPINYDVVYYPTPSAFMSVERNELVSGESATFKMNVEGGQTGKWTYEWLVDGVVQTSAEPTFLFNAFNEGNTPKEVKISCNVHNDSEYVALPFNGVSEHSVTVYPMGGVTLTKPINQAVFSGETISMDVKLEGGYPQGWQMSHYINNVAVSVNEALSDYNFALSSNLNVDNETIENHSIVLTNTIEGREVFNETFDFKFIYYPKAAVSFELPNGRTNWVAGDEISMNAVVSGGEPTSWQYKWDNGMGVIGEEQTFTFKAANNGEAGKVSAISLDVTNTPEYIVSPFTNAISKEYMVWNKPKATVNVPGTQAVFSGQDVTMSVVIEGGMPSGWKYFWTCDGTPITGGDSLTQSYTVSQTITHLYKLHVTNEMDGVEAYAEDFSFEMIVYPTPSATFSLPEGRTAWMNGEEIDVHATVSGGSPDSWIYVWTLDDNQKGVEDAIKLIAENNAPNGNVSHMLKLQATNAPAGILEAYTTTLMTSLVVWPTPELNAVTQSNVAAFSGEEIPISIAIQGGVDDNWQTTWSYTANNGTSDSKTENGNPVLDYSYIQTSSNTVNGTVSVNVVNTLDGNEVFNRTLTFDAIHYPTPLATFNLPQPREDWMNGESISLTADVEGGDSGAWTYSWKVNDNVESTAQHYDLTAVNTNESGYESKTITLTAVNSPANLVTPPRSIISTENIKVWATGDAGVTTAQQQAAYSGQEMTFAVASTGGFEDGWTYTWTQTLAGEEVAVTTGTPSLTVSRNVNSEEKLDITLQVKNDIQDNNFFYRTYNFSATFYPTPSASDNFDALRNNWMNGESVEMTRVVQGGASDVWTTEWSVNGETFSSADEAILKVQNLSDVDTGINYTLSLRVVNEPQNILAPYVFTDSKQITVWPTADTSKEQNAEAYYSGQDIEIGVSSIGGDPSSWTYEWLLNGNTLNGVDDAMYTFKTENANNDPFKTDTYTVIAKNTMDGFVVYEKSTTFTINTYLAPEAIVEKVLYNLYVGDEVTFGSEVSGGYPTGWSYSWNTTPVTTSANLVYKALDRDADSYTDSRTVTIVNNYGNLEWYRKEFTVNINVWKYPDIKAVALSTEDYNGEADVTLQTEQTGGNATGWTYVWRLNGKMVAGADEASLPVNVVNNGSELETLTYELTATNRMEDHDEFTKTMTYVLRVWPQIHLNSEIDIPTPQIRQNNIFNAYTEPMPSGGYDLYWTYDWKIDGTQYSTDPDIEYVMTMQTTGEGKQTETHIYNLQILNPGPDGTAWQQKDCTPKTVTVYRRPRTPQQLVRKGDGTTHTLIAMIPELNDSQLSDNEYTFTFGYTDTSGQDHALSNGTTRYARVDSGVYDNSSNKFWVYTLWNYADGSRISSGRRYLSGDLEETFDASIYSNGGRGPQSGLNNIVAEDNGIYTDGYSFAINVESPCNVSVNIYNVEGIQVSNKDYLETYKVADTTGVEELAPGNYIVVITAGSNRKSVKVSTGLYNR